MVDTVRASTRLLADEAQVKSEEFNNLMRFRQYVKDRVSQLHALMSVGWDTQAMQECRSQYMTRPEKKSHPGNHRQQCQGFEPI